MANSDTMGQWANSSLVILDGSFELMRNSSVIPPESLRYCKPGGHLASSYPSHWIDDLGNDRCVRCIAFSIAWNSSFSFTVSLTSDKSSTLMFVQPCKETNGAYPNEV
ncbi:hypothetical protein WICPIJ_007451 [Wickerhamomyces pijperi]|uniref:Uncharacterized protein n=1 Tax=Wickerhamomyces pijperi TaxID=599730 RepID=A0A9P8Q0H4_WICPI|nr:hypothetical protein WICPIJ_007451 [Wickerhamomyces pijperi]